MITILSAKNMRASDAACIAAGTDSKELMKRAGQAVFDAVWGRSRRDAKSQVAGSGALSPVAIVCGSGNNAGDGYVLALLLKEHGIACRIFLLSERFSEDGRFYFEKCRAEGILWELCSENTDFSGYGAIADCIFGTGFRGRPEGLAEDIIKKMNMAGAGGAFVVSVDINSGLNAYTGMGEAFVRSDLTVSIGCYKPGHFLNMAKDAMKLHVNADIGIPPAGEGFGLIEESDVRTLFPERKNFSNKGDYGYAALIGGAEESESSAALIGGSLEYSGAIRLAALGNTAMRAGAGVASIAAPSSICPIIAGSILEPTLIPLEDDKGRLRFSEEQFAAICSRYRLIAFGMGSGSGPETLKAVRYLLENYKGTLILDADGLNALARLEAAAEAEGRTVTMARPEGQRLILTPHLKEFSRLAGCEIADILADPIERTRALAAKYKAIVMQKGPATIVSDGDRVLITDRGCPGMATGGSGDVLSGILAAICCSPAVTAPANKEKKPGSVPSSGDPLLLAAAAGAWINGAAGELAQSKASAAAMTAGDTARCVAAVINSLQAE